ncbi:MAG: hypothetical protein ACI4MA_05760 [Treponema sp.]
MIEKSSVFPLYLPSTILISLSVAVIILYIASKSEIAAEIFSIMAGDSFDTFSTRQDFKKWFYRF